MSCESNFVCSITNNYLFSYFYKPLNIAKFYGGIEYTQENTNRRYGDYQSTVHLA